MRDLMKFMKGDDSFRTTPMYAILNNKPHLRFTRGKWVAYYLPTVGADMATRWLNRRAHAFIQQHELR